MVKIAMGGGSGVTIGCGGSGLEGGIGATGLSSIIRIGAIEFCVDKYCNDVDAGELV
jgi:hypothetical protein